MRIENLATGRPEMTQTLDRAQQFLSLVALLTALLAAVAVAVAARDFASATSTTARCCACWARRSGRSRPYMRRVLRAWACSPASSAWALGFVLHLGFVALLAGLVEAGCRRRARCRRCWAWASA